MNSKSTCFLHNFKLETPIGHLDINICSVGLHQIKFIKIIQEIDDKFDKLRILDQENINFESSEKVKECLNYFTDYFYKKIDSKLPSICWSSIVKENTFSERVLKELIKTKFGQTLSYKDLAKLAASSNAHRAVGSVMKKNKIPLIIPCHRVIKADNNIGNYSYGNKVKEWLINHEK